ncbi:MAG: hypothetical protein JO268_15430 [Pseudonocardiales bacterium]|nr:hypothetical protein [Pseudonocardiales bacterium]
MACGVMVAGCAATPGSPHVTVPAQSTPSPVSPEAYATELRAVGDALKTALDGIGAASPGEPLASQVDSAAAAVHAAAQRLTAIAAPTRYVAAQAGLVSALDQLTGQLSGLRDQVQSRELCTAPSVMATLSSLPGADALRRAAPTLGPGGADLAAALPAREPLPDRHESNGEIVRAPGSGNGELKVENGTDHDAVVTISRDGRAVGSFYVTHGGTAQMADVPDGTYDIFLTSGTDWDGREFTRSCAFQRFDATASFTTTKTQRGIRYTIFSVTLQPVPNGNTRIVDVSPDSLPK